MKVILKKDVKNQGEKGETIEVKPGYGQNFLLKNGFAVLATKENVEKLKKENQSQQAKLDQKVVINNLIKKEIESMELKIKVKVKENDEIFGSITEIQILKHTKLEKYDFKKHQIIIKEPITKLGTFNVKIKLDTNVEATIRLNIVK